MDPQRWKKIDNLLQSALGMPSDQWEPFLRKNCHGDEALEREVLSVLHSQRDAGTFMAKPAIELAAEALARDHSAGPTVTVDSAAPLSAGTVGSYRLLHLLGTGGMGEVWRAEQTKPLRRTVAIKLIKAGMDTRAVVARFESERQTVALMDHPNIAKVFDAGETPAGKPYFVMEYVPGSPITGYCDKNLLTINERLQLFLQVCEGVRHAHQKAIIHRDLKPSNLLVQEIDDRPIPKIIDFGLAKALGPRLTDVTMYTEVGMIVGTPAYVSPEQADSQERNIDTRTDVYSLGVILYELLVGALPFEERALRNEGLEAMLRKIREEHAVRPSVKLSSLGKAASDSAIKRKEEPDSLVRRLRGDLDWITLKAMEKDRNLRYGSASELAADIERHLSDLPVLAGPPSVRYRAGKFIRRHRFGVAAAGATLVLLIALATNMTVEARRIARERDRANREAEISKQVSDFMINMFKVSDPNEARGNTITAREILDRAQKQIDGERGSDPQLQAKMLDVMGVVYTRLGLLDTARPLLERAVNVRTQVLGKENPETLESDAHLAWLLYRQGKFDAGIKLYRQTLEIETHVLGSENLETLRTMDGLASTLDEKGDHAEAETLERQALLTFRRILGPNNIHTLDSMNNMAGILTNEAKYAEADPLYRETIDVADRVLGHGNTVSVWAKNNLAWNLHMQGDEVAAESLGREAVRDSTLVFGPQHQTTGEAINNLAAILRKEKKYPESEKWQRQYLALAIGAYGPKHANVGDALYNLGCLAALQGRSKQAIALIRQAVERGLDSATTKEIANDADLASLRKTPEFRAFLVSRQLSTQGR